MKVLRKNTEQDMLDVSLLAEPEEFAKALEDAYVERTDVFPVPGVAAGLATRKQLEETYGEQVLYDEAVDLLVPEIYREFLSKEGLQTVGTPELMEVTWQDDGGFSFDVRAALMPSVELGAYKGLECPYSREDQETFEGWVLAEACRNMKTKLTDALVELRLNAKEAQEKMKMGQDPIYHVLADSMYALREGYYLADVTRSATQINAEAMDIMLQTVSGDNRKVTPERFIYLVRDLVERYHVLPEDFDEKLTEIMKKRSEEKKKKSGDELLDEAFKAYLGSVELTEKQWRDQHRNEAAKEACLDLLYGAVAKAEKLEVSGQEFMKAARDIAAQAGVDMEEALPEIDEAAVRGHLLREKARKLILDSAVEKPAEGK